MYNSNPSYYACKIINNLTGKEIIFPVMPESISESVTSTFTQQDIIGASIPKIVYSHTSAETMNLSLTNLTEDYLVQGYKNLDEYVRTIKSLAYPEYSSGIVRSPDLTLFLGNRAINCVCNSVGVSWGNTVKNGGILSCSIDLSFIITRKSVPGGTDIINDIK